MLPSKKPLLLGREITVRPENTHGSFCRAVANGTDPSAIETSPVERLLEMHREAGHKFYHGWWGCVPITRAEMALSAIGYGVSYLGWVDVTSMRLALVPPSKSETIKLWEQWEVSSIKSTRYQQPIVFGHPTRLIRWRAHLRDAVPWPGSWRTSEARWD